MLLPGSKSLTNRDLILAALTSQTTILEGVLFSEDTHVMIEALRSLGYILHIDETALTVTIEGGVEKLRAHGQTIHLGNSGTSMRFLTALCCLIPDGSVTLTGVERMCQRPIGELTEALRNLGANIIDTNGCPPLTIQAAKMTKNTVEIDGSISSQFISALMMIAPCLPDGLTINIRNDLTSFPYVQMTAHEMRKFGMQIGEISKKMIEIAPLIFTSPLMRQSRPEPVPPEAGAGRRVSKENALGGLLSGGGNNELKNKNKLEGLENKGEAVKFLIEGDASALSYWALASLLHGREITIDNIGNSTQQGDYGFLKVLEPFGLHIEAMEGSTTFLGKNPPYPSRLPPIAGQVPDGTGSLSRGRDHATLSDYRIIELSGSSGPKNYDFSDMPDVSMTFFILAIFLPGKTHITGLHTLNKKECRRIEAMGTELRKLGVEVEWTEEDITIGEFNPIHWEQYDTVEIETYHDHRIAMCFGILDSLIGKLRILDPSCVNKTYPRFWDDLELFFGQR